MQPQRASTSWWPWFGGWWKYSRGITRLCSIHLPLNSFSKDQEEIWALINWEWSQYLDLGGCIKSHGLINQCRNSQDWRLQPQTVLYGLGNKLKKVCLLLRLVCYINVSDKKKSLPKYPMPLLRFYQFRSTFYLRLK